MSKKKKREHRTKSDRIIRKLGFILQIGGTRAFILHQVVGALGNLYLDSQEIIALSRAIASFENLVRQRRLNEIIRKELSGGKWQASFRKVA
ncbi:MAG: hypothetical protein ACOZFS_05920 [Thermodesulfobacteriota bacterium]